MRASVATAVAMRAARSRSKEAPCAIACGKAVAEGSGLMKPQQVLRPWICAGGRGGCVRKARGEICIGGDTDRSACSDSCGGAPPLSLLPPTHSHHRDVPVERRQREARIDERLLARRQRQHEQLLLVLEGQARDEVRRARLEAQGRVAQRQARGRRARRARGRHRRHEAVVEAEPALAIAKVRGVGHAAREVAVALARVARAGAAVEPDGRAGRRAVPGEVNALGFVRAHDDAAVVGGDEVECLRGAAAAAAGRELERRAVADGEGRRREAEALARRGQAARRRVVGPALRGRGRVAGVADGPEGARCRRERARGEEGAEATRPWRSSARTARRAQARSGLYIFVGTRPRAFQRARAYLLKRRVRAKS